MQYIFPLWLTIRLFFLNKNFLLSPTECPGFQWVSGCLTTITWPGMKCKYSLLSFLWQNQKSCKSSLLSQWRGITFVLSTEATIPDKDYKENIVMLTEVSKTATERSAYIKNDIAIRCQSHYGDKFNCTASYVKFDNNVFTNLIQSGRAP